MLNKGLKPVLYDKDKAVSPIIATILLVAITVILASTLYLALGGFFTAKTSATPSVALVASSTGTNSWTITTGSTSSNTISWTTTSWVISSAGGTYTLTFNSTSANSWNYKSGGVTAVIAPGSGTTLGTYITSGIVLTLTITNFPSTPTTIAFEDTSSTNGGQMGSTSL